MVWVCRNIRVFRAGKSIILPLKCSDYKPSFILCSSFLFCPISVFTHSTTQYFQVPGISVPGNEVWGMNTTQTLPCRSSQQDEQTHRQADQSHLSQSKCWILWDHRRWRLLSSLAWVAATRHHRQRGLNSKHSFLSFLRLEVQDQASAQSSVWSGSSSLFKGRIFCVLKGGKGEGALGTLLWRFLPHSWSLCPHGPNHLPTTLLPDAIPLGLGF